MCTFPKKDDFFRVLSKNHEVATLPLGSECDVSVWDNTKDYDGIVDE